MPGHEQTAPDAKEALRIEGVCPACDQETVFSSRTHNYRGNLYCANCGSVPRERALAWALTAFAPDWRDLDLHESSPAARSLSLRLKAEGTRYIDSQFFPGAPLGQPHDGVRCENLEALTFADESLDLHVHLDVLEHVNQPKDCFAEMERTLRPGGRMIFTTPIYGTRPKTERRALYTKEGVRHLAKPEYHGNPVSADGALVTFHYGADFANLIRAWAPRCGVMMLTPLEPYYGIVGGFREVFVVTKRG